MIPYQQKIVKGMTAEFQAAQWLIGKGYNIYWRTRDCDPIDFVAVNTNNGEVLKVDVKTASIRKTWKPGTLIARKETKYQQILGVKILYVFKDGKCKFK
jgi:Holliday junction resolvase-like predicted endonuclease